MELEAAEFPGSSFVRPKPRADITTPLRPRLVASLWRERKGSKVIVAALLVVGDAPGSGLR